MLNFLNRDGTVYKNLTDRGFSSFKYGDINEVQVEGSGEQYQGKVCYVYDSDTLVGSGIVETYAFDKNANLSTLKLYPLHYDLRNDFVSDNTGNIVYYDDTLENVLASIITKYRASTSSPLIYAKNLPATGISVKYTFSYKTFLEAWNVLVFSFLPKEMNVLVEPDGGVSIITAPTSRQLSFGHDVQKIKYEKKTDEIVNYVVFDNKRADNHILKIYQDSASITAHGKRVRYWDDARVQYESTADAMVAAFFSKSTKATIEVEDITTTNTAVQIYDKITINNWEKDFDDDLFVVGISTLKGGKRQLRIGTQLTRSVLNQQGDIESVNESVEALAGAMPSLPSYIKETYIDSTEIRSPVIAGNNGYFTQTFRVGSNGIVIDGANQIIKSASYNAANHTGWQIANSGAFEFGGDANNYLKWDGSNLYIKGVLDWGDIDNRPADSAILNTSQQWNDIQSRPTYIQNTYISSTEVRSPQISGSSGYFTDTFYVGQNGIVIDGIGKFIKSSNYDPYASTGWKIENSGNFFF